MEKPQERYIQMLRQAVEDVFGRRPMSPSDFDRLSDRVSRPGPDYVATSTLKRLWGYVRSSHRPTFNTLSVLSRYAGYRDWNHFMLCAETDSGFTSEGLMAAGTLPTGMILQLEWNADKKCVLRKVENPCRFEVVEAVNIKLRRGDMLSIDAMAVGERFIGRDCRRGDQELGSYIGARHGGLTRIALAD